MHLVRVALLLVSCARDIKVSVDRLTGKYDLIIGGHPWLRSSYIVLYANDR